MGGGGRRARRSPARATAAVVALGLLLGACGDGDGERDVSDDEQALLADGRYGEETFVGASVGGVMAIDDDLFRLGVVSSGDGRAQLAVIHSEDRSLNRELEVEVGSVFAVGDHRVRVVTVGDQDVAVEWARLDG